MSFGSTKLLAASGGKAYEIEQSVVLDEGDSALLYRTPSSEGNRKTWTFSCWFKRTKHDSSDAASGYFYLFASSIYGGNETFIRLQGDHLQVSGYDGGSYDFSYYSNFLLRDVAAWYHIVVICDTTESTETDRVKVYLNGSQVTDWGSPDHPSLNFDTMINNTNWHAIGAYKASSGDAGLYHWDGLVAEAYLLDGTAKAVTAFGETDSTTGQWIPKKTAFTSSEYGTNGFYLKFASGAIGTDSSGEGNNYTLNGGLVNGDILLDTPTNNFPIVNILEPYNTTISTFRQGTLNIKASAYDSGNYGNHYASFILPTSGKWYVEMLAGVQAGSGNVAQLGISSKDPSIGGIIPTQDQLWTTFSSTTGLNLDLYGNTADLYDGGSSLDQDTSLTATSYVCALAVDIDNDKVWVGYDGGSSITWLNSGDPANGSNGAAHTFTSDSIIYMAVATSSDNANRSYVIMNFGQNGTFSNYKTAGGNADGAGIGNFYYAPPSGFKALCSKNLPTPAIKKPTEHFNTVLYTGNETNRSITNVGFEPSLVWIKERSAGGSHRIFDQVRGVNKVIQSDLNTEELDRTEVTAFNSDGFSLSGSSVTVNQNSVTHVAWNWKAGGSGSTNNDGAEASTVSVNTTAGFSIMKAEGTGSSTTYGHGLGVVPKVYIVKLVSDTGNWFLQTSALDGGWDYIQLNGTGASASMTATAPTSSVITGNIASGETAIYYSFAEVEGFSKFGSYRGNGESENGPYIYTGFSPALVIVKETSDTGGSWFMWDNKREVYNVKDAVVWADGSYAETSDAEYEIDFLSNGFKIRGNSAATNQDGETMLYLCWAEAPFKYSLAR